MAVRRDTPGLTILSDLHMPLQEEQSSSFRPPQRSAGRLDAAVGVSGGTGVAAEVALGYRSRSSHGRGGQSVHSAHVCGAGDGQGLVRQL